MADLVVGEGAGSGAQQLACLGVEVGEGRLVDADRDSLPGEDLGSEHGLVEEADGPARGHDPVDLDRGAGTVGRGQWWWPGGPAAGRSEAGDVGAGEVRAN